MKRLCVAAAVLMAALSQADAQTPPNEAAIRAGGNVAVTMCIACHIVSPNQSVKPVLGPGIPSFAEIANRRDVTVDGLRASMKIARWHDPGIAATLLPMSRISDTERSQVAAYILSLRAGERAPGH